jgi:hypothetical protein
MGHGDIESWGKATWATWQRTSGLRLAVIQCVQIAYRIIDAHGDAATAPLRPLLRHLASVPNSGDNRSPFKASQVLRRIVEYVGVGFFSIEGLNRRNAKLRRALATQRETIAELLTNSARLLESNARLQHSNARLQENSRASKRQRKSCAIS